MSFLAFYPVGMAATAVAFIFPPYPKVDRRTAVLGTIIGIVLWPIFTLMILRRICMEFGLFKNWGFVREYYTKQISGFGLLGCEPLDQGVLIFDWGLRQIHWQIPSTKYTRAIRGGCGLGPARAWLNVRADRERNYSCFSLHIIFPFARGPLSAHAWPFGRISIGRYPQNNVVVEA